MTVTFTNIPIDIKIQTELYSLADVVAIIDTMKNNDNKAYTIHTRLHINSMEMADKVDKGIGELHELGALNSYQTDNARRQIEGFRSKYLR